MNWNWNEFSLEQQGTMTDRWMTLLPDASEVGVSAFVNGLFEIEYPWNETDPLMQAVFERIVSLFGHRHTNPTSGRQVANIIYYLGQSGMIWEEIPKDVQDSLLHGIYRCYRSFIQQEIFNIING
jgi:hypothetical protein